MQLPWLPPREMFAAGPHPLSSGTADLKHLMALLEETEGPALRENMGLGAFYFIYFIFFL